MPEDLISNDTNFYSVYIHSGITSTITTSFSSPWIIGMGPQGLTFDGGSPTRRYGNLVSADESAESVFIHAGVTSTITTSFSMPEAGTDWGPIGITVDASGNLISARAEGLKTVRIHAGITDTVTTSFSTPFSNVRGITVDASGNLISVDIGKYSLYIHAGITSTITTSFTIAAFYIDGLEITEAGNLLAADYNKDTIHIHSGITSTVTTSFSSPKDFPWGLTVRNPPTDASTDLLSKVDVTHSVELLSRFEVGQAAQDLLGKGEIQQSASIELLGKFDAQDVQSLLSKLCVHKVPIAQDLSTWTEYDPQSELAHDCNDSWWTDVPRLRENTALTKDAGLRSNFFHEFILNVYDVEESADGDNERICAWAASTSLANQNFYDLPDFQVAALIIMATDTADEYQLKLIEKGGNEATMATKWPVYQDRYIVIYKEGDKLIASSYEDAGHKTGEDGAQITLSGDLQFRYISMPMSYGQLGAQVSSGYLDPIFGSMEFLYCKFISRPDGAVELPGKFEVGQDSADLPGRADARQSSSAELLGKFEAQAIQDLLGKGEIQQSASIELLGKFEAQAIQDLLGKGEIQQSTSAEMLSKFEAQATQELLGKFAAQVTRDLFGKAAITHSVELLGRVGITHSVELLGKAGITHSVELFGKVGITHSVELFGKFEAQDKAELFGKANITHSVELLGKFEAQAIQDLLGKGEIQQSSSVELLGKFIARHVGTPIELLGKGIIRHEATVELLGKCVIRHEATVELLGKFIARHEVAVEFLGKCVIRHETAVELLGKTVIRHSDLEELLGRTKIRHTGIPRELLASCIIRHSDSKNLDADVEIVHWKRLSCVLVVRHTAMPLDLPAIFWVRWPSRLWTSRRYINGVIELDEKLLGDASLEYVIEGVMEDTQGYLDNADLPYSAWTDITLVPVQILRAVTYGTVASLYARHTQTFRSRVIPSITPVTVTIIGDAEKAMNYWEDRMNQMLEFYVTSQGGDVMLTSTPDEEPIFSMEDIPEEVTEYVSWRVWLQRRNN